MYSGIYDHISRHKSHSDRHVDDLEAYLPATCHYPVPGGKARTISPFPGTDRTDTRSGWWRALRGLLSMLCRLSGGLHLHAGS